MIEWAGVDIKQYFNTLSLKKYISGIMASKSGNWIEKDIARYKQRLIINDREAGWYRSVYPFGQNKIECNQYWYPEHNEYKIEIEYKGLVIKEFKVETWNEYLRQFKALKEEGQYEFANKGLKHDFAIINQNIHSALIKNIYDEDIEKKYETDVFLR